MFFFNDDQTTEFIKSHNIAVLATVDDRDQPSSSAIFYKLGNHNEILFLTKSETTKYKNLQLNKKVAMTILDPDKPIAMNLTGQVIEVTDTSERDAILQGITTLAHDTLQDFAPIIKLHKGSFKSMKFIPEFAKLTDYTKRFGEAGETLKKY